MATSNPVNDQLYPFSTEDGKTIPLDIIRPVGLLACSFAGSGAASVVIIPAAWSMASFYSKGGCIIQFGATTLPSGLSNNTEYLNTLLVPPGCLVVSTLLPGEGRVFSLDGTAGQVFIQRIQKWAGIALRRQVTKS